MICKMLSNHLPYLASCSALLLGPLYAEDECVSNMENSNPAKTCSCCANSSSEDYRKAPPARFDLSGGALYWYSKQNGLSYTNKQQSVLTTGDFTTSSLVHPDFGWDPGFKLAASYGFEQSFWSTGLSFIYFKGCADGKKTAAENFGMFPVLSFADSTLPSDYATSASVDWDLSTAIFDAIGSYEWRAASCFSLIPFIALRDVWFTEKVKATYRGGSYNAGPDVVHLKSDFYGIGPQLGITPIFKINRMFAIYGKAAVSYLYGWFDVKQRETFISHQIASLKRHPRGSKWNGDFSAGMTFTKYFDGSGAKLKNLNFDIGFDYLFFTKQYAFANGSQFSVSRHGSALILYGAHLSVGTHF